MTKRTKYVLALFFSVITISVTTFFLFLNRETPVHYDFIAEFPNAEKVNFDENTDLNNFMPDRHLTYAYPFLQKEFATLFSFSTVLLAEKGVKIRSFEEEAADGAFRLAFPYNTGDSWRIAFDLKIQRNGEKWSVIAENVKGICRIEVLRYTDGKRIVEDTFDYPLKKDEMNIIVLAFFGDFLVAFNNVAILYQQKDPSLLTAGRTDFSLGKSAAINRGMTLKFAPISESLKKELLKNIFSIHKNIRYHKFNIKSLIWNGLYARQDLLVQGKKNPYLQRVKFDFETRPVVLFKMNSSLKYKLKIPEKAALDFYLAVVPKFVKDIGRLKFRVEIEDASGRPLFKKEINLSSLKDPFKTFNPVRIALSKFAGEEVIICFRSTTSDGQAIGDEDKIIYGLASPAIYMVNIDKRPNVILISLDALRQDHLGCYGYNRNASPNIDKIAGESTIFTNAITTANWTIPSHMSILTGLYPMEAGYVPGGLLNEQSFIAENVRTLAEYLKNNGYFTLGVHGGGYVSEFYGFDKGFSAYIKGSKDIAQGVRTIIENLDTHKESNFFLFFHTLEIHWPYTHDVFLKALPSGSSAQEKIIAGYDSGIKYADEYLGKLYGWLDKNRLLEKTIIIIISDHGETFRFVKEASRSGSHGSTLLEEEIKIPMIVRIPSVKGNGKKVEYQISTVDLVPTILDCLNLDPSAELRGISLLPLIKDNQMPKSRFAYTEATHSRRKLQTVRSNDFKLLTTSPSPLAMLQGKQDSFRFIDLKNDPLETGDLWKKKTVLAKSYADYLQRLLASIRANILKLKRINLDVPVTDNELEEQLKGLGYIGN
jgi:arylsulfatase A-like enzyme